MILDKFINVVENVKYVMQCFQDLEGVENLKCLFFAMQFKILNFFISYLLHYIKPPCQEQQKHVLTSWGYIVGIHMREEKRHYPI